VTIERVRGPQARAGVIEHLRGCEPRSTAALAALVRPRRRRWQKVWAARDGGRIVGVLVSTRFCFDRWNGTLLLDELSHAEEIARALDRSNAWTVVGPFADLDAVLPHVKRYRNAARTRLHFVPYMPPREAPPRAATSDGVAAVSDVAGRAGFTVRRATQRDRRALVNLYLTDQRIAQLPRSRVPGIVRRALPNTLVAESSDGIKAAIMSSPGIEYELANRLVLDPAVRGGRLMHLMVLHAAVSALAGGRGSCAFRDESRSPRGALMAMRSAYADTLDFGEPEEWLNVSLWPPRRFRGHSRLRFALERVEKRVETRLSRGLAAQKK
jgi:hypothetical protein